MTDLSEDEFLSKELKDCPKPDDFNGVCRVCLSTSSLHSIFGYREPFCLSLQDLSGRMENCTGIQIENGDGMPSKICEICIHSLQVACRFRSQSETSDRKLRDVLKYFKQENTNSDEESIEFKFKQESSDSDLLLSDLKTLSNKNNTISSIVEEQKIYNDFSFDNDGDMIVILQTDSEFLNENDNEKKVSSDDRIKQRKSTTQNLSNRRSFETTDADLTFYGCLLCEKRFVSKNILQSHMADTHGEVKPEEFRCHACDKVFDKRAVRLRHERKTCPKMPPGSQYQCRKCPAALPSRIALERHLRQHEGGAPRTVELGALHVCPVCRKTLQTRSTLRTHIRSQHMQADTSQCPICNKKLKNKHALYTHMQTHDERTFSCNECSYRTNMRTSLTLHKRRHSGEKPFACEWCAHRTVNISNLNRHRMTHTGVKNHECSECGKRYMDKSSLTSHISSYHRGLRPFFCDKCGSTYARRKDLRLHQNKIHPEPLPDEN